MRFLEPFVDVVGIAMMIVIRQIRDTGVDKNYAPLVTGIS